MDIKEEKIGITDVVPKDENNKKDKVKKEVSPFVKKIKKIGLITLIVVFVLIGIVTAGMVFGVSLYPKIGDWLDSKGISVEFFNKYRDDEVTIQTGTDTIIEKVIKVTSEENNVIQVVNENMHSVVSIAMVQSQIVYGQGSVEQENNVGSGFVVDSSGLIVTNQHVVSNIQAKYKIITDENKEYEVKNIIRDDMYDIAILEVEAKGLDSIDLGNSDNVVPGQTVIAIGNPLGQYAGSVTTGVISGLNRSVTTSSGSFFGTIKTYENVIQTDAAINPGNSGGPLLNSAGEVIGVNFATSSGADNISFALPINRVKARLEEYRKYGKFLKPYIGIEYQMISEFEARFIQGAVPGAYVRNVVDASPAFIAGIKSGDIITKLGGKEVTRSFSEIIQEFKIGEEIEVELFRNNETLKMKVKLTEAD